MEVQTNNRTIARNTVFLYIRMMFTMIVSLYTSRIVLQVLGVEDYGIYQVVGGIVGFLSFLNGALATGSSRFLTFELGTGDEEKLKRTFSTTLTIHIIIAFLIVVLAETIGLWVLRNKLVIPADRMDAALYVFHFSVLTAIFSLTQIPYGASIIAHEKMSVFAYMSIVEVSAKLLLVYLLEIGDVDKLKLYATLIFIVQVSLMIFYRFYCVRHFRETIYRSIFDKEIFKLIAGFSGWSLFGGASIALSSEGILLLLNLFFSPAIVTARAISIQVNMAATQFVYNFRTAVNPQIVKKYAAGDVEGSKKLLLASTKYTYYLMFLLCFPIYLLAEPLLKLWLGVVPEYTVVFLQLIVIQSLFQVFDASFYIALYAKGQLKENALISPTLVFLQFPVIYFMFKCGYSPIALSWAGLAVYALLGLVIRPVLIVKIANYKWVDIWNLFKSCLLVTITALPVPVLLSMLINRNSMLGGGVIAVVTVLLTLLAIYIVGIEQKTKKKIMVYIKSKYAR